MIKYIVPILGLIGQFAFANPSNGIKYINQQNNDNNLLVMISGYHGVGDMLEFKELTIADDSLEHYDILIYGLQQEMGINENANNIKNIINNEYNKYQKYIVISYSLGGIVAKQFVLNQLQSSQVFYSKISDVIFIGTPHIKDEFTVSFIKKTLGNLFYFLLPQILKDASENEKLSAINNEWIQKIEKNEENYISNITIFGRDDSLVKPEKLENYFQGEFRVIAGTHRQLVQGIDKNHCSFKIIRSRLLNKKVKIGQVSCINP